MNEILNTLINQLEVEYSNHGYIKDSKISKFKNDSFEVFWGKTRKYPDVLYITPTLSIVNKQIVETMNGLFPQSKNLNCLRIQGADLAVEMGNFEYEELRDSKHKMDIGKIYKVEKSSNPQVIIKDHFRYMEDVGFNFFAKMETLDGMDEFLNNRILSVEDSEIQEYSKSINIDEREIVSGLIIAKELSEDHYRILLAKLLKIYENNEYMKGKVDTVNEYYKK